MSLIAMIAAVAGAPTVAMAQAVLIEISPSQSAMQVGATRSLSARGFTAANDPVLDLVVSWRSSQPEIASADASGTVRALAPGTATITATTEDGVEGAAPVTVEAIPPRDSVTLIDDAVARGEISADDGIRYRLFAILGDAALPEAYRSDVEIGHLRMPQIAVEAANRLDLFSPQQGELVESLFIPPGYPGSWADRLSVEPSPPDPDAAAVSPNWQSADGVHVRVWWNLRTPGGQQHAERLRDFAENSIWPQLVMTAMAGRGPISDAGLPLNGGDDRYDIWLIDASTLQRRNMPFAVGALTLLYNGGGCGRGPTYIQMNQSGSVDFNESVLAHELMHAIQYSYAIYPVICSVNHWLLEGTAAWVEDYIRELRDRQTEHQFVNLYFDHMDEPLDKPPTYLFEYGRYLFFFFLGNLSRSAADVIRATFQPYDSDPTPHLLTALDAALQATGHGDLRSVWPNFTVSNWNRPPAVDDYLQWDGLNQGAKGEVINLNLIGGSSITKRLRPEARPLSSRYYRVTVDPSVRSLTIFNPFADGDDSAALRALVKVRGRPWRTDDWSRNRYVTFCLNLPPQNVEEIVLISSNTDWHHPDHVLNDEIILEANNVSCLGWTMTGTENDEVTIPGARTETRTASLSGSYLTTAPLDSPYGTSPLISFAFAGGQMTASEVVVDTITSCTTTTGPVTTPLSAEPEPGVTSYFWINDFAVKDVPGLRPRTYAGATTASTSATAVTECPGGSMSGQAALSGTGFLASPEDRFMVGNDGSINGSARTTTTTSELTATRVIEWRMSPYSITQPPPPPSVLP